MASPKRTATQAIAGARRRGLATSDAGPDQPRVTVVVPCFNEAQNIEPLAARLLPVLDATGLPWQAILVNDGSRDDTWSRIERLAAANPSVIGLDLSRNFGKEVAIAAGLDHADGDCVVVMDADLQHPPETIPAMISAWRDGAEIVDVVRDRRVGQRPLDRFLARQFYRVMRHMSGLDIPDDVGDFRLFDRRVVEVLRGLRERRRFTKGLVVWLGFDRVSVPYKQESRRDEPHRAMGFGRRLGLAVSGITSFSSYPMRVWSVIGFAISGLAFVYMLFRIARASVAGIDLPGYESIVAIMLFLGGVQLITLGILGEYIGSIYEETKGRPLYVLRRTTASARAVSGRGGKTAVR